MSSGRDVYLEMLGTELPKFPEAKVYTEDRSNKLDTSNTVTYYLRVNGDKITWGYMKQLDDNLVITYNKDNNTFTVNKL